MISDLTNFPYLAIYLELSYATYALFGGGGVTCALVDLNDCKSIIVSVLKMMNHSNTMLPFGSLQLK